MFTTHSPITSLPNKTLFSTDTHSQQIKSYSNITKDNSAKSQAILDSFKNDTIDTADIVSHRQQLISLGVDKYCIRSVFRKFQHRVFMSSRSDRNERLQAIKDSGDKARKIQSKQQPTISDTNILLKQAMSGTLPLNKIEDLRNSLLKTHDSRTASARLYRAKMSLIKHNTHQESQIKAIFDKLAPKTPPLFNECKYLQTKIKKGNLTIQEFTRLYESIPQRNKTSTLSTMCSKYIKEQSDKATTEELKLNLFKSLPKRMQNSSLTIRVLFPTMSNIISSIKTGTIRSIEIKNHLQALLKIITIKHLSTILNSYMSKVKHLSDCDRCHILECKQYIKHLQQPSTDSQVIIPIHQHYTRKAQSKRKKLTPDLDPKAKCILESLRNCTIPIEKIVEARIQLLELHVEKGTIRNTFKAFKHKIQLSDRQDKQQIIKEIDLSGKTTKGIQTAKTNHNRDMLYKLSTTALTDMSTINIQKLRDFLFDNYNSSTASSKLNYFKKQFIKKQPTKSKEIKEAFSQASPIKHITSKTSITLRNAIKKGNLPIKKFTLLYNALPTAVERGHVQKICSTYIHSLSQQRLSFTEKLALVKSLPQTLQTSQTVFKSFFPDLHEKMSSIRTGEMESNQLKQTCTSLLDIIPISLIRTLLSKYVKNKQAMTTAEKQHVSECKEILLNTQTLLQKPWSNDDSSDQPGHSSWYTDIQQVQSEMVCNRTHESTCSPTPPSLLTVTEKHTNEQHIISTQESTFTDPTSTQQSTSYAIENGNETSQSLSLVPSNELNYILQSIVDEDKDSENNLRQQYLLQLAQELQQEADTIEVSTSQPIEKAYTSQAHAHTETIDYQDFLDITELVTNFNNNNFDQLADNIESTIPLPEIAPEEFFNFYMD